MDLQVCICSCWFDSFFPFPRKMFPSAAQSNAARRVCKQAAESISALWSNMPPFGYPYTSSFHNPSRKFLLASRVCGTFGGSTACHLQGCMFTRGLRDRGVGERRYRANQNKIKTISVGNVGWSSSFSGWGGTSQALALAALARSAPVLPAPETLGRRKVHPLGMSQARGPARGWGSQTEGLQGSLGQAEQERAPGPRALPPPTQPLTLGDGNGLKAVQLLEQAAPLGGVQAVDEVARALRRVQRLHGLLLGVGAQPAGAAGGAARGRERQQPPPAAAPGRRMGCGGGRARPQAARGPAPQ